MKNGTLTFDVGDVHVEFNLLKAAKFPSIFDECNLFLMNVIRLMWLIG